MADYDTLRELITYKHRLSDESLDALFALGVEQSFGAGEAVIRAGSVNDNLYLIKEGFLRAYKPYEDKELTLLMGDDGDIFLSAFSFHGGLPAVLTIEACCDSVVIRIAKQDFMELLHRSPDIAQWAFDVVMEQLFVLERKTHLFTGNAYERYESMMDNRPDIFLKVPLRIIASYLGVTQSCPSRLRRRYVKERRK